MIDSKLLVCILFVYAGVVAAMEEVVVEGRQLDLVGVALSASEGVVGQKEIELRPLLRTGEVLELVPGLVVTQHSGTGKANQYFLRGFNLDHGTDFATFIDGMPINMRSHGHGQGYTDLNFLIPETVGELSYKKGAYHANTGDFGAAGSAHIETISSTKKGVLSGTLGEDDFYRLVVMDSFAFAGGETLVAFEGNRYDGPWVDVQEDLKKNNLLLKHTMHIGTGHLHIGLMAYDNSWNSADQIPERAVQQGIISELGSIDDTVGGESSRYSINFDWRHGGLHASAYGIDSKLNLWSNFTYFLEDETNGDQFEQVDDRQIFGGQINYKLESQLLNREMMNRFGADLRIDNIDEVSLFQTRARQRLGVTRSDAIEESSLGLYWENQFHWTGRLRTVFGARYEYFDFDVEDRAGINRNNIDLSANSGSTDDDIFLLKGSVIFAPTDGFETYISAGEGFHSNDARGTVINVDPADGNTVDVVDPLVRSFGYEAGIRVFDQDRINASLVFWQLSLDSELLFVGDAGNTEPSRSSKRKGIEATFYYRLAKHWNLDIEYAYSDAEFDEFAPEGNEIPGAVDQVFQAGISADFDSGWFGSLRVRHFGNRPLIEDGSVESDSTTIWNLRAGYRVEYWTVRTDILNLADSNDHDISYFYESRLATEPTGSGTEDIHFHVIEPRTVRLTVERKI